MTDLHRDSVFEEHFTREAARSVGMPPDGLYHMATARAHPGPVLMKNGRRNLILEAREELADCRNYLVWLAWWEVQHERGELLPWLGRAVAAVVVAWHALDDVERVLTGH